MVSRASLALIAAVGLSACRDPKGAGEASTGAAEPADCGPDEELLNPETCRECHPRHFEEWSSSMHAYAADDPVFLAMNRRGQRETNGELGDFCVRCHAPMALVTGATEDGLNMADVPQHLKGVTCYFCHNTTDVVQDHNAGLRLACDGTMRGGISDPAESEAHRSEFNPHFDRRTVESGEMCGACHDIVNGHGLRLERTFEEWRDSLFAQRDPVSNGLAAFGVSCSGCHLPRDRDAGAIAEVEGVPGDRRHASHLMAGVDLAVTPWPGQDAQRAQAEELRATALCSTVCAKPADGSGTDIEIWLHNEAAGHEWPSGATADRRAWVELRMFAGESEVYSSGVVADGEAVVEASGEPAWELFDRLVDADGEETHNFWDAVAIDGSRLGVAPDLSPSLDQQQWEVRRIHVDDDVTRIASRVRLRPIGLDVLRDLVDSGDLDPAIVDAMETFDVAPTVLEWPPVADDETANDTDAGLCLSTSVSCGYPPYLPE